METDEALRRLKQVEDSLEEAIYQAKELEIFNLQMSLEMVLEDTREYGDLLERFGEF